MPRLVDFFDGQQSATPPTLGSLDKTVTGSEGAPIAITAGGGISIQDKPREMIFVEGSGGAVDITAVPQIEAGTSVGQELELLGTSDVNTVLLEDGNGLKLNGAMLLKAKNTITLVWTGSVWKEKARY